MKTPVTVVAAIGSLIMLTVVLYYGWESHQRHMSYHQELEKERLEALKPLKIERVDQIELRTRDLVRVRIGYRFEAIAQPFGPYGSPLELRRRNIETALREGFRSAFTGIESYMLHETFSNAESLKEFERNVLRQTRCKTFSRLFGDRLSIAWIAYANNRKAYVIKNPNSSNGPQAPEIVDVLGIPMISRP